LEDSKALEKSIDNIISNNKPLGETKTFFDDFKPMVDLSAGSSQKLIFSHLLGLISV